MACNPTWYPNGIDLRPRRSGESGGCFLYPPSSPSFSGWADYRDTATEVTPITIEADVWTSLTANGVGSVTNSLPLGADGEQVTQLWNSSANRIDISELQANQIVSVRSDFRLYPSQNNAQVDFRFLFQTSGSVDLFDLQKRLARLDEGADTPAAGNDIYKLVESLEFFISENLPLDAFISIQVKCSVASEAEVNGFFIRVS